MLFIVDQSTHKRGEMQLAATLCKMASLELQALCSSEFKGPEPRRPCCKKIKEDPLKGKTNKDQADIKVVTGERVM